MKALSASFLIVCLSTACSFRHDDDSPRLTDPEGPVAASAAEAWPKAPTQVPAIDEQAILDACALAGACAPEVTAEDKSTRVSLVQLCVSDMVFSAERAIPISQWSARNERAEYWVDCVLTHTNDCGAVNACATKRDSRITCQEDGCSASEKFEVSCNGSVATLKGAGASFSRDCARAFAECDPKSETGCTDRHYSACPKDISTKDRCDGDVRLGCDGMGQVSYHDCTRLGGICGTTPDGSEGCIYPAPVSAECGEEAAAPECSGATLSTCVNGQRVSTSTSLCQGP
ncbi:MAG: hypothetical protein IPI67_36345 [Myxococcales bacterium]|nr:hypothetical protein [Myxococcales bacterium]